MTAPLVACGSVSCSAVFAGIGLLGDAVRLHDHLTLRPEPSAARSARRFVTRALQRAPLEPPMPQRSCGPATPHHGQPMTLTSRVALVTSELVTNAVIHGGTSLTLAISVTHACSVISVHDHGTAAPLPDVSSPTYDAWGLGLVDAMADRWSTVQHVEDGKTVWCELCRPSGSDLPGAQAAS